MTSLVTDYLTVATARETIRLASQRSNVGRVALAVLTTPEFTPAEIASLTEVGVTSIWFLGDEAPKRFDGLKSVSPREAVDDVTQIDLVVAYDPRYWDIYQKIGMNFALRNAAMERDIPIIPYAVNAWRYPILPEDYLNGRDINEYRLSHVIYQYITRSNLRGSYAEFGTWFGRSFYRSYLQFAEQLQGSFWAFDSFGGLPKSRPAEAENTKGDFTEGRYFCNEASFREIGRMAFPGDQSIDKRVKLVKGFYDQTLDGHHISEYGIKEKSISYCSIDCDLFDATLSVLRFIEPALEDGCLMYLDDYRMSRAAKEASLYHAVKVWLSENPSFELIELHQDHWQHQFMIFNRY
jgi:hypothetical protein